MHGQHVGRKTCVLTYGELGTKLWVMFTANPHAPYILNMANYIKLGGDNHVFKSTFGHLNYLP